MHRQGLKQDVRQVVDQYVSPDRIATVIFQDMFGFASGFMQAYEGDLFHDAMLLNDFKQQCILKMAERNRDWFTYRCNVSWLCRETGTHYWDCTMPAGGMFRAADNRGSNPLKVDWYVTPNWEDGSGNSVRIERIIRRCPEEWNIPRE